MTITAKIDGKIARTGEVKTSPSGKEYYNFTVGVYDARMEKTEYVQATAFDELAESLGGIEKGASVTVLGVLRLVDYLAKDGVTKQALNLTVNKAVFL